MQVQFVAGISVIAPDPAVSRRLYVDTLGLPLAPSRGGQTVARLLSPEGLIVGMSSAPSLHEDV